MTANNVKRINGDKVKAADRLRAVSDLANSNAMLSYHLRATANSMDDETYMSNGLARAIARLSNL